MKTREDYDREGIETRKLYVGPLSERLATRLREQLRESTFEGKPIFGPLVIVERYGGFDLLEIVEAGEKEAQ